jgi:hypothetical protein
VLRSQVDPDGVVGAYPDRPAHLWNRPSPERTPPSY